LNVYAICVTVHMKVLSFWTILDSYTHPERMD